MGLAIATASAQVGAEVLIASCSDSRLKKTLGKALAVELAPVRVNVISPGMTRDTGAYLGMPHQAREEMLSSVAQSLPVKRVGLPSDIASIAVELMSNSFITGTVIDVDGGGLLS